jgi:hypothetical protein
MNDDQEIPFSKFLSLKYGFEINYSHEYSMYSLIDNLDSKSLFNLCMLKPAVQKVKNISNFEIRIKKDNNVVHIWFLLNTNNLGDYTKGLDVEEKMAVNKFRRYFDQNQKTLKKNKKK